MKKMEKTYRISFVTYLLVSMIIFFVIFSSFLMSSAYFGAGKIVTGTITLMELDFQILNNLSQISTVEENLFMPDEVIDNSLTILNARDEAGTNITGLVPIFIRVKPVFTINSVSSLEYLHIELYQADDWVQGSDEYLYYKYALNPSDRAIFNNYFVLSYYISNPYQNASVYLGLQVDAVQVANFAYLDLWTTAPEEWKNIVNG